MLIFTLHLGFKDEIPENYTGFLTLCNGQIGQFYVDGEIVAGCRIYYQALNTLRWASAMRGPHRGIVLLSTWYFDHEDALKEFWGHFKTHPHAGPLLMSVLLGNKCTS